MLPGLRQERSKDADVDSVNLPDMPEGNSWISQASDRCSESNDKPATLGSRPPRDSICEHDTRRQYAGESGKDGDRRNIRASSSDEGVVVFEQLEGGKRRLLSLTAVMLSTKDLPAELSDDESLSMKGHRDRVPGVAQQLLLLPSTHHLSGTPLDVAPDSPEVLSDRNWYRSTHTSSTRVFADKNHLGATSSPLPESPLLQSTFNGRSRANPAGTESDRFDDPVEDTVCRSPAP